MYLCLRSLHNVTRRHGARLLVQKNGIHQNDKLNCLALKLHTTAIQRTLWESDKKYGYRTEEPPMTRWEQIKDGLSELKHEFRLFLQEIREKWESDPVMVFRKNETDVVFTFKSPESLDKWMVGSDSDHKEGRSTATLTLSPSGHGLFSGYVNSEQYRDGKVKRTGYASIRTLRVRVIQWYIASQYGKKENSNK